MSGVSVVIPALNAAGSIAQTLTALRGQAGAPPFETIVVDNGSADETACIAEHFGVKVVHEPLRGPAAARNRGLAEAAGAIVLHLDADTVPTRRWVAELAQAFDDPRVIIAAGNTMCYPPKTAAERYAQAVGLYDARIASTREAFPFAPSLNLAVRANAARAAGGWNPKLLTGEDVDFSHRIIRLFGTSIHYCARAALYHHARADDMSLRRQARGYGAGAADLYRMYPDELTWDARKSLHVLGLVARRAAIAIGAQCGARFGKTERQRAEFLCYQAMWTRNFWLGFALRRWQVRGNA